MRCRYRENIYSCGEFLEVDIFPTFHKGNDHRRKKRYKPTAAMQERLNQRNAERALTRILEKNYIENDIEVTITYRDDTLPETYEQAYRDSVNYLRRVKRLRTKLGLPEMKTVTIPGGGRFHFHIIMSGGVPREKLEELWGKGFANTKRLQIGDDGLAGLAIYDANQLSEDKLEADLFSDYDINEETGELIERVGGVKRERKKGERRFVCSKNIERPEPEIKEGRISQRRAEQLATIDAASHKAWGDMYEGYTFVRCEPYYNEENGGWYIHVRLRRDKPSRNNRGQRTAV